MSLIGDRIERGVSLALAISAIIIAAAFVYRQFDPAPPTPMARPPVTVTLLAGWRELLGTGRQVSNSNATVQLIEFIDLECPACRAFANTLSRVQRSYGSSLGVTLIHFPLPMHRFARQAARVAECGVAEGKFNDLVRVILNDGDSLVLNRWAAYGRTVGIRDSIAFTRCLADTAPVLVMERGLVVGDRIGVRATPTILVNGWRYSTTPTEAELKETIDAVLKGERPPLAAGN